MFAPGKVESVTYMSGEKALQALSEKIKAAQYQVEWPVPSQDSAPGRTPLLSDLRVLLPKDNAIISQNASQR